MQSPDASLVPIGYVRLFLIYEEEDSPLYLQIPLNVIASVCLKPRKYLVFLGWCILGIEGYLALNNNGELEEISNEGDLDDEETYYYRVPNSDFSHAVDLEAIKNRSIVPSVTSETRNNFRAKLVERDAFCVLTGASPTYGEGLHIIPHRRGSDWFSLIVQNRPTYGENIDELSDIDDIRNGMLAHRSAHCALDLRNAVILHTPNAILNTADIPERSERPSMPENVIYPRGMRYTLQWLSDPDEVVSPNNRDAAFKKHTQKPKPSPLLLHYNYGAAAVKQWGNGIETFQMQTKPPGPAIVTASRGPTTHDRNATIQKLNAARDTGGAEPSTSRTRAGTSWTRQTANYSEQRQWDEDDVMLFFWGNSKAARDRHEKKLAEQNERMKQWREGVNKLQLI